MFDEPPPAGRVAPPPVGAGVAGCVAVVPVPAGSAPPVLPRGPCRPRRDDDERDELDDDDPEPDAVAADEVDAPCEPVVPVDPTEPVEPVLPVDPVDPVVPPSVDPVPVVPPVFDATGSSLPPSATTTTMISATTAMPATPIAANSILLGLSRRLGVSTGAPSVPPNGEALGPIASRSSIDARAPAPLPIVGPAVAKARISIRPEP